MWLYSGTTFQRVPTSITPTVMTAGWLGSTSRLTMVWIASTIAAVAGAASMP